jgi:murein DD-endopeptidase MepM/ murein hydrolase activator NlpD
VLAPVGKPGDAGEGADAMLAEAYKLRTGPGTAYAVVTTLAAGQRVTHYPATRRTAGGHAWQWTEAGDYDGWCAAGDGDFLPVTPAPTFRSPCAFLALTTSLYGQRRTPERNDGETVEFHDGVDFAPPTGAPGPFPVVAPAAGQVTTVGYEAGGYGNYVKIGHEGGYESLLGHLARVDVEDGDELASGAAVGQAGTSGRATGLHVHWRLRRYGISVDPLYILPATPPPDAPVEPEPPTPPVPPFVPPTVVTIELPPMTAGERARLAQVLVALAAALGDKAPVD